MCFVWMYRWIQWVNIFSITSRLTPDSWISHWKNIFSLVSIHQYTVCDYSKCLPKDLHSFNFRAIGIEQDILCVLPIDRFFGLAEREEKKALIKNRPAKTRDFYLEICKYPKDRSQRQLMTFTLVSLIHTHTEWLMSIVLSFCSRSLYTTASFIERTKVNRYQWHRFTFRKTLLQILIDKRMTVSQW